MRRLAFALAAVALLAACSGAEPAGEVSPQSGGQSPGSTDAAVMESVVREWSRLLNGGENVAVARLFALPALVAQGEFVAEFSTYEGLADWHARLPCSGMVQSVRVIEPDVVEAVFELGNRPTSPCDAPPGTRAAARFVFREGLIVAWRQVPVPGAVEVPSVTEDVV